jgi:hypothetical protein
MKLRFNFNNSSEPVDRFSSITFMVVMMVSLILIPGCGSEEPAQTPIQSVKAFMSAVENREKKKIWNLLAPETKKKLEKWAEHLKQSKGLDFSPVDLISPSPRVTRKPGWQPEKYKLLSKTSERAVVELSSQSPANVIMSLGGISLGLVAGSSESLHFAEKPQWVRVSQVPLLGLSMVVTIDKNKDKQSLTAGRRQKITLVRHKGKWLIDLNLEPAFSTKAEQKTESEE